MNLLRPLLVGTKDARIAGKLKFPPPVHGKIWKTSMSIQGGHQAKKKKSHLIKCVEALRCDTNNLMATPMKSSPHVDSHPHPKHLDKKPTKSQGSPNHPLAQRSGAEESAQVLPRTPRLWPTIPSYGRCSCHGSLVVHLSPWSWWGIFQHLNH